MSKSTTKQLKQARKQIDAVTDQLDLDKRMLDVADKAGLAKRRKVLGVPVSRKKPMWGRIATYGAAAALGAAVSRVLSGGDQSTGDQSEGDIAAPEDETLAEAVERGAAKGAETGIKKAIATGD